MGPAGAALIKRRPPLTRVWQVASPPHSKLSVLHSHTQARMRAALILSLGLLALSGEVGPHNPASEANCAPAPALPCSSTSKAARQRRCGVDWTAAAAGAAACRPPPRLAHPTRPVQAPAPANCTRVLPTPWQAL